MKQRSEKKGNAALIRAEMQARADAIEELCKELAAEGLIVDTGLRKWRSPRRSLWESKIYRKSDH
jgi:hypothetical protein